MRKIALRACIFSRFFAVFPHYFIVEMQQIIFRLHLIFCRKISKNISRPAKNGMAEFFYTANFFRNKSAAVRCFPKLD